MGKDVYDHIVELLDRKFRFLMESHDISFMLELERFVAFLTENELIRDAAKKLKQEVDKRSAEYLDELKQDMECACKLKDQLIAAHPQTADLPGDLRTFAEFDLIVSDNDRLSIPEFRENTLADETTVARLILILSAKLETLRERIHRGGLSATIDGELDGEISYLNNKQQFNHKKWFNFNMTSSGRALIDIEKEVSRINPVPVNWASVTEESRNLFISQEVDTCFNKERVGDATYAGTQQHKYGLDKENRANIADFRQKLRRVYEGVRQEIGTTRLRSQMLDRYATRCKLYNREAIHRQLVVGNRFRPKREAREHQLTQDLALYLYDQGITTTYRLRVGNREPDLISKDCENPMIIEVKAYKGKEASRLQKGIYQLHDYLCYLESDLHLYEGYYVYFCIGGPVIRFEDNPIRIGGFNIHPVIVDLAESEERGSKAENPITITREMVESGLIQYKRTSSQRSRKTR